MAAAVSVNNNNNNGSEQLLFAQGKLEEIVSDVSALMFSASLECPRLEWLTESRRERSQMHHLWRPASAAAGARERRQMVQACRALRMQIKKFEEEFETNKGHAPRGAE